ARLGELIVLTRRTAARFLEVGLDQTVGLHAAHQRIDRAFTHADRLREATGDVVGIAVAASEHGEYAHVQDAFPQLHLKRVGHPSIAPVFGITRYLAKQDSALYRPCPEATRGHRMLPVGSRYHALDARGRR